MHLGPSVSNIICNSVINILVCKFPSTSLVNPDTSWDCPDEMSQNAQSWNEQKLKVSWRLLTDGDMALLPWVWACPGLSQPKIRFTFTSNSVTSLALTRENYADTAATCLENVAQDFEGPGWCTPLFGFSPSSPPPWLRSTAALSLAERWGPLIPRPLRVRLTFSSTNQGIFFSPQRQILS